MPSQRPRTPAPFLCAPSLPGGGRRAIVATLSANRRTEIPMRTCPPRLLGALLLSASGSLLFVLVAAASAIHG